MKNFIKSLALLSLLLIVPSLKAQQLVLGAQLGAIGLTGDNSDSSLAYGPFIEINPYGWAAFKVDGTLAHFGATGNYFSTSPSVMIYPISSEEFNIGLIFGPGFYKIPGQAVKFGLSFGAGGDFAIAKQVLIGMEARYNGVFASAANVWTVFLTLGFRFEGADSW